MSSPLRSVHRLSCITSFLDHCSGLLTGLLTTSLGLTESILLSVAVVQLLSYVRLSVTPLTAMPGFFVFAISLFKLMSIESVMPFNHFIFCCPHFLPSIFPSITVFSIELTLCIRWSKYWSLFSASALPMNIQGWFPLILTGSISLQSKGLSRVFSSTTFQKHQFFTAQPSFWSNSHIHIWLLEKQVAFTLTYGISNLSSHIACYI